MEMEASAGYVEQLESALDKRAKWLEEVQIPLLKDTLTAYQSLFEGAMAMLIRKGLLREDPYNYEQAFTEIVIPSDDILPDFENADEVSFRLASFRRQLKFVSSESTFDLHSLGLARLKKLSGLISYINWLGFGEGSTSPTTRAFARAFMKVRMGSDTMASQILKDAEIQIVKTVHQIRALIAEIIAFHRESWKAELRRKVLAQVDLGTLEGRARKEEAVRAIRRGFVQSMNGKPWYPALSEEVIQEEIAQDGPARKEKILASLAITEPEVVKVAAAPEGKTVLMEAVRILCRPHEEVAVALAVLEENERLLHDSRGSSGGWFRRLLGRNADQQGESRSYKVQYSEPGVPTPKTEVIDFPAFLAETQKKSSLMAALASGKGPAYRKLDATIEELLANFLDRQLNELLLIHRRLSSLNTLFQARAAQEKKSTRGIKIELLTIKNAIVKANQRRHEYRDEVKD
jgi:hypothetical protein